MTPHWRTARATCYNGRNRFILGVLQWGKRTQCRAGLGSGYSRGRRKSTAGSMVGGRGWHRMDRKYQEAGRFLVHSPNRILADDWAGHCTSPGPWWLRMRNVVRRQGEKVAWLRGIPAKVWFYRETEGLGQGSGCRLKMEQKSGRGPQT